MNKKIFAVFSLLIALTTVSAQDFVSGKVNVDLLNMRIKPGRNEAVVGKIVENSEVRITRVIGNWLEISAPDSLKIFVAVTRINRNSVVTGELNMRCAMDINAPILGVLTKGVKVEQIGAIKHGWVQIKKPAEADIKVYVSAFLVNFDSSKFDANGNIIGAAKKEAPATAALVQEKNAAPIPEAKETAPAVKEVKAAEPEKKDSAPAAPGKIELTGTLVKYKFSTSRETEYVLLTAPNGYNQGFITGDSALLQANENKKVKITGTAAGRFGENGAVIVKVDTISAL